ncbi:MAG TPA: CPBP family intramembrane glutamic endopeptidase [Candidatus Polarisedimenticolaceae bacterium]|nr:CPBP family intramembrane glutamic endopeptidase [Candidatus Polarisedimenticolaceae bacterium]
MTERGAARLSVAVVIAAWAFLVVRQILRDPAVLPTPEAIVIGACLRAAITLVLVWALLRAGGESLRSLGFDPGSPVPFALRTLGLAVALFLVTNVVVNGVLTKLVGRSGAPPVAELFHDPRSAPLWIVSAVVGGGFSEELGRAFVLTRFEKAFGRAGLVVALVVDTAVFGLGHLYQGTASAISAGLTGVILAFIFLWRRRVVDAMTVHALFDLMGIAVAFALYGRTP